MHAEDEVQSMAVPGDRPWGAPAVTRRNVESREADFVLLFEEFSAPIYNYVLRMVSDPDRAADITQDTFIKAYRKLDTVTDATSTRSWLYRIATNTAIDDMRRRKMVTTMSDDQPAFANRADHGPGPEAQVIGATLDERVQRALLTLRPNHRQCLLLSDLEDMSAQQVGEVMGLTYGAVRTLLCRARGEMRRALAAEGFAR
jgi:RNA polymerase sigma-70 factor (ECF subfamily)